MQQKILFFFVLHFLKLPLIIRDRFKFLSEIVSQSLK